MDDFARCAALLASPATAPAVRAEADAWLASFRRDPAAWGVALGVLQAGPAAAPPEVRLQAAALLAWKAKRQLSQLQPPERQAELAEALTALVAAPPEGGAQRDAAARGCCVALANLALRCRGWARPLDTLGPRLGRQRLLEFLTLLPQECEDAVAAVQASSAELGWGLKARAHEWSPQVAAWLHALHASAGGDASATAGAGSPRPLAGPATGSLEWQQLTLGVLRCFAAWVKLGALQHAEPQHAAYLTRLAGELLFTPNPSASPLFAAAVDAATEVVEHATDALQPLLGQLAAALPARAAALCCAAAGGGAAGGGEAAAEELAHVFSLFCSTNCGLCLSEGPEGRALRQGLLQLLALPLEPGGDGGGAALPAMGALADLLEHAVAQQRGERGSEEEGEEAGAGGARPLGPDGRRAFAAAALDVLLVQLQPFEAAFAPLASEAAMAAAAAGLVQHGTHSPEGVPDALRREAAPVVDHLGDLLGAEAVVARLAAHAEAAAARHGARSAAAQAALDVALHLAEGLGGLLEACCCERTAGGPLPGWLGGLLRLYTAVPAADGSAGPGGDLAPLTILHADLLASWAALGPLVVPLLQASQQEQQQGVVRLVLAQALRALCCPHKSPDVAAGSTEDVVERGAAALRVLCSSAAAAGLPTPGELLEGLQRGMLALQAPGAAGQYQEAHGQLVAALVHALHGVPPGDLVLRAQAEAAVQQHVFQPLAAALAETRALAVALPGDVTPAAARAAVWRLHAALRQLQALLNQLESYAWYEPESSSNSMTSSSASLANGGAARQEAVARGVAAAAVASFLAAWPQLAQVCAWAAALPAPRGGGSSSLAAARREAYAEAAQCLCSSMSLDPEAAAAALPSLADAAAAHFFLPGGTALSRPLILALEAYGGQAAYQGALLSRVAAILAAPPARQLAAPRGGDADPEAAQALLSLLGCCLRQAAGWRAVPQPAAVEAVLRWGLPLAAANTACHHRDTSLQAVGTLAALLALVLAADSPLHGALLGFAAQQGPALVQGLLLALLSLSSGSSLPKVMSLMGDTALLAATLAAAQQAQQQPGASPGAAPPADAVAAAAGVLLASWLAAARDAMIRGSLLSEDALAALLAQFDWQPVLQQAAAQLCGGGGPGGEAGIAQARRAMQRSLRQLADAIRRAGNGPPALA